MQHKTDIFFLLRRKNCVKAECCVTEQKDEGDHFKIGHPHLFVWYSQDCISMLDLNMFSCTSVWFVMSMLQKLSVSFGSR